MIIVITGSRGKGKSTLLEKIANSDVVRRLGATGFISCYSPYDSTYHGYDLLNVATGQKTPLAKPLIDDSVQSQEMVNFGGYRFFRQTLALGNTLIRESHEGKCLFIDEIGRWELTGGGWYESISQLSHREAPLFIGMRQKMLQAFIDKLHWDISCVYDLDVMAASEAYREILKKTQQKSFK